jgi:hypothetical protein
MNALNDLSVLGARSFSGLRDRAHVWKIDRERNSCVFHAKSRRGCNERETINQSYNYLLIFWSAIAPLDLSKSSRRL